MREDDVFDIFSDFDGVFVFGVDGINSYGMENNAVFLKDGLGDSS